MYVDSTYISKNLKRSRDHNKKFRKMYIASYLAKKFLAIHSAGSNGYYMCLFMQSYFQLGSYIHGYRNQTHSLVNLQQLIANLQQLITSLQQLITTLSGLCCLL